MKTDTENKLSIVIPFTGFYESDHDAMIDDEINNVFETDDTGCYHNVPDDLYNHINYRAVFEGYSKEYVEQFQRILNENEIDIKLEFESLVSPREYNFTTDRIFCYISPDDLQKLFTMSEDENHITLKKVLRERHTSRSGFASFYSNDLDEWLEKPLENWDHNERESLLIAVMQSRGLTEEGDEFRAYDLMDGCRGNGVISSLVTDNMDSVILAYADDQRQKGEAIDFKEWKAKETFSGLEKKKV